jgi:hypothetical protein
MVKAILLAALLPWLAVMAQAAPADDRFVLDTAGSEDSDGLRQHSLYAGAVRTLPALGASADIGVRAGYWQLEGAADRVEFTALRVDHRRSLGPVAVDAGLHPLFGRDWSPLLAHLNASVELAPVSLVAGVDRELVDTVIAARREITLDSWHLVADYTAGAEWTLVAGGLLQDFSDSNHRKGGLFRIIYSPSRVEGLNAQLRLRRLDGDRRGIGYFSPDRFEEGVLLLQYGHALPGGRFVLTAQAGGGQQRIDGRDTNPVFVAELRARGWFTDTLGLEGRTGCSNTGDLVTGPAASGYRYCHGQLTLMRPW